ncbi:hypothetical protein [Thermomonas sp.]|uniref:hypothetical protein n=1 Tax=Thermomonas sp. TaxID=1971895 RepID=UPI002611062F|nr:hypothetical protein [Thermomonas sp.]
MLEIDWQGARLVRRKCRRPVVSSSCRRPAPALEERMRKRAQDSEDVIRRRLAGAREEMRHYDEFDYVVINDVFETAVSGSAASSPPAACAGRSRPRIMPRWWRRCWARQTCRPAGSGRGQACLVAPAAGRHAGAKPPRVHPAGFKPATLPAWARRGRPCEAATCAPRRCRPARSGE